MRVSFYIDHRSVCLSVNPSPPYGEWHIAPKHVTRSPWPRAAAGAGLRARGVEFRTVGSDKTVKS